MGIRDRLRRLQRATEGELEHFELEDGERFWFERAQTEIALFIWGVESGCADSVEERPKPPPIIEALKRAKDRRSALLTVYPTLADDGPGNLLMVPFDTDAFVERGELIPYSVVAGRELGEPVEDLSSQPRESREDGC